MRDVLIGTTDYTVLVKIVGADGAPESGLAHTDIDIAYARVETDNDVTTSDVAPADLANLTAAHSDWGWEEVSATDHPGLYRLDIADAVFASGAWESVVTITDASGSDFYAHDIGFRLVGQDKTAATYAADVLKINSNTEAAVRLDRAARAISKGTVGSASTTTSVVTSAIDPAASVTDQWKGLIMAFDKDTTTVGLRGQKTDITGSSTGGVFTVTALTTAPVSGDTFTIE
jgi:hypothetical protein